MHGRILPQQFRPDAWILDLARRDTCPLIGGDIACAIARGLHRVDADRSEIFQRIRQIGELDPIELDVLPCGEVAIAAVIASRHMRHLAQLRR